MKSFAWATTANTAPAVTISRTRLFPAAAGMEQLTIGAGASDLDHIPSRGSRGSRQRRHQRRHCKLRHAEAGAVGKLCRLAQASNTLRQFASSKGHAGSYIQGRETAIELRFTLRPSGVASPGIDGRRDSRARALKPQWWAEAPADAPSPGHRIGARGAGA